MLEPSFVAPERDLLDVQINIADVNPIVRNWRIHPHVIRAQQLHIIIRHKVSVKSHFYNVVLQNYLNFAYLPMLITYLNLKLQKFDILCCFLKHRTNVNFCSIGNQVLQDSQPLIDPLSPLLQN